MASWPIELANEEGVLGDFQPVALNETADGLVAVEGRESEPETSRMRSTRWLLDGDENTIVGTYELDLRAYAPVESVGPLADAGFRDVRCFGSYDGEQLIRGSARPVALAGR
ncbi:hypothetical protein [Halovivax sp.]|uniref:hypothetical protein n=1 Tax=Halovivax sp. TaxID=1935978 RepID=UPI0025BBA351|nr:hypothetical protein [Halovivax sp.]